MELAPQGVACSFEVTFDSPSLFVGMSVFDMSTPSAPVLVQGPTAMINVVGNTYSGSFTPPAARPYVIFKAVYTTSELVDLSPNYSQGSESIIAQFIAQPTSNSTGCSVVGYVQTQNRNVGSVC